MVEGETLKSEGIQACARLSPDQGLTFVYSAAAVKASGCELLCKPIRPAELRALMRHVLK